MKIYWIICWVFIQIPVYTKAQYLHDTIIHSVKIQFTYSHTIFPDSWQTSNISADGSQINVKEAARMQEILKNGLSKYPSMILQKELNTVYCLRNMFMYHVPFGGTNSTDAIYLTNDGEEMGYTDDYIEQTLHHEFSSILFRNHPSFLDTVSWKAINTKSFIYTDPEAGVGAIRNENSGQDFDTTLCRQGFLTQYATSDIENDINTIAQNLFKPAPGFWDIVHKYQRIGSKVNLLIGFYYRISPIFNKQYFMQFN